MNYVVLMGTSYSSFIEKIQRPKFKPDNIIGFETSIKVLMEHVKYEDVLSSDYLVILTVNKRNIKEVLSFLKFCESRPYVCCIIYCPMVEIFNEMIGLTKDFTLVKYFDCWRCSNEIKEAYIIKTLKEINPNIVLTDNVVTQIRRRVKGYYDFNKYLNILAWQPGTLTEKIVNKVIPRYSFLKVSNFSQGLFLYKSRLKLEDFDDLLYHYRHNLRPIVENIKSFVKDFDSLYRDYMDGNLNEYNYLMYLEKTKIKGINAQNAERYIEAFKSLSPFEFIAIKERLSIIQKEKDPAINLMNLYRFVRFVF